MMPSEVLAVMVFIPLVWMVAFRTSSWTDKRFQTILDVQSGPATQQHHQPSAILHSGVEKPDCKTSQYHRATAQRIHS
jgi:hypothetical protein